MSLLLLRRVLMVVGPFRMMRGWGIPREFLTMWSFSFGISVWLWVGDSFSGDLGGEESSSQKRRGRQNGCSRLSISLPALRFVADVENDRLTGLLAVVVALVDSERDRRLQARRKDPNRRIPDPWPWSLLFELCCSSSFIGVGGMTWQIGGCGAGRGFLHGESTSAASWRGMFCDGIAGV